MFNPHDVALLESFWTWLKQEDHLTDEVQLYGSAEAAISSFYDDQASSATQWDEPGAVLTEEMCIPQIIEINDDVLGSFITTPDNPFVGNTLSRKQRRHLRDLAERTLGQDT